MLPSPACRFYHWLTVLFWLVVGNAVAQIRPDTASQTVVVKGTVDSSYRPRAGVVIAARRSGKTTQTDKDGKFELSILPTDTLIFKYADLPTRTYVFTQLAGDAELSYDVGLGTGQYVAIINDRGDDKPVDENLLPKFTWPVPQPSARYVLDDTYFAQARTLSQVDQKLSNALRKSGYPSSDYYWIPNGFAVVNQLEQIEADGTPKADPADRWSSQMQPLRKFDLTNYLRLLFTSTRGYFRVVVFLITNVTNSPGSAKPDIQTTKTWINRGGNVLPEAIGKRPYGSDYHVTALIYEFEKPENGQAHPVSPSAVSGQIHLAKSNIINYLSQ